MNVSKRHNPLIFKDHTIDLGTSRESSRLWHIPKSNECYLVPTNPVGLSHSRVVHQNQKYFNLTETFDDGKIPEYHGDILYAAMKQGAVRVLIDKYYRHVSSVAEGSDLNALMKTVEWMNDNMTFVSLYVSVRHNGHTGDNETYHLHHYDKSLINFIREGILPTIHVRKGG